MSDATPLDPIDGTAIGPGLVAISLAPTVWDEGEDGQHAVDPHGRIYQRRAGLWHCDPWWQGCDQEEILAICADPDEYGYDRGWPRHHIENARGPLTFITLPGRSA